MYVSREPASHQWPSSELSTVLLASVLSIVLLASVLSIVLLASRGLRAHYYYERLAMVVKLVQVYEILIFVFAADP